MKYLFDNENLLLKPVFQIRIRICIRRALGSGSRRGKISPQKEEKLSLKTRKNMTISIFYAVIC
jgi:hypothetical protein